MQDPRQHSRDQRQRRVELEEMAHAVEIDGARQIHAADRDRDPGDGHDRERLAARGAPHGRHETDQREQQPRQRRRVDDRSQR